MKSYIVTINTRDGEHEYIDKTILELTDEQAESPSEILSLWRGFDDEAIKATEVWPTWYEFSDLDYRHYQVYYIQEIKPEHVEILHSYGIY